MGSVSRIENREREKRPPSSSIDLSPWLPIKLPVFFHGDDPHAERLGRHRHHANLFRLEFRVRRVLGNGSERPVGDVVLVEVSKLGIHDGP